ncbi:MAG: hypothetical protein H3Z50_07310 [archaeon]|nr:hypothetical protein [archaeon]MCP8306673.1 hypothetical protein [archaeon]
MECAVVLEGYPEAAEQILKHGGEKACKKYTDLLKSSETELGKSYKNADTFHKLSQRAHPLKMPSA